MAGTSLSVASSATVNRGGVPVWTGSPQVRGLNEVDRKLTCKIPAGSYSYTPTLNYARPLISYQWKRDGVAIVGETDPFYMTTSSDLGKALTCTVTLTGENGSASATSGNTFQRWDYDKTTFVWSQPTTSNVVVANTATTTINLKTGAGWKTSHTTGSMTAGSPTLTVADASGFSIGDQIIVATGGESGGGVWGTMGVGGSWPTLYYANAAAMNADTSQATDTYCWLQDSGRVYVWNGSAWIATWTGTNDPYYFTRATPKALVTTIANKVGNVLTLNANAVVSTTNANVYFDVVSVMPPVLSYYAGASDNVRLYLPTGEYACSNTYSAVVLKDIYFEGDGPTSSILFSPDGCPSFQLRAGTVFHSIWRNFGIRGNHKLNSWGIYDYLSYPRGLYFDTCPGTLFYNIRSDNTMNDAFVWGVNMLDCVSKSCYSRHPVPTRMYLQWSMNVADSEDCWFIDYTVNSDYVCGGCEIFRSDRSGIIRFTGTNAYMACNTVGAFVIDSPTQTFTANSIYNYDPTLDGSSQNGGPSGVAINVNNNIGNTSGLGVDLSSNGGSIINPTITFQGFLDATHKIRNTCIIVAPSYQAVMMRGGRVEVPAYQSGTNEIIGIGCDGDGLTVANARFIGFSGGDDKGIWHRLGELSGHGRTVGCVAENIRSRVNQRNQTNAEYIAAGGT